VRNLVARAKRLAAAASSACAAALVIAWDADFYRKGGLRAEGEGAAPAPPPADPLVAAAGGPHLYADRGTPQ